MLDLCFSDHKESPFENKTIDRTLSVELSGTPGKKTLCSIILSIAACGHIDCL